MNIIKFDLATEGNPLFFLYQCITNIAKSDEVVKEAMEKYWREKGAGTWHFIRTSVLEQIRPEYSENLADKEYFLINVLVFIYGS